MKIRDFKSAIKSIDYSLTIIFLIIIGCNNTGQKDNIITDHPKTMQGTYQLQLFADTSAIDFQVELVTGTDGQVYGFMKSDFKSYQSPIALDSVAEDSLYFHAYTNRLRLTKTDSLWRGKFTFLRKEFDAVMRITRPESATISNRFQRFHATSV